MLLSHKLFSPLPCCVAFRWRSVCSSCVIKKEKLSPDGRGKFLTRCFETKQGISCGVEFSCTLLHATQVINHPTSSINSCTSYLSMMTMISNYASFKSFASLDFISKACKQQKIFITRKSRGGIMHDIIIKLSRFVSRKESKESSIIFWF